MVQSLFNIFDEAPNFLLIKNSCGDSLKYVHTYILNFREIFATVGFIYVISACMKEANTRLYVQTIESRTVVSGGVPVDITNTNEPQYLFYYQNDFFTCGMFVNLSCYCS